MSFTTSTHGRSELVPPRSLSFNWELRSRRQLAQALFIDELSGAGLRHMRELVLTVAADERPDLLAVSGSPLFAPRDDQGEAAVFEIEDGLACVATGVGTGFATVAAATAERADALAASLAELLSKPRRPPARYR
jgi:hypothetical protein